MQRKRELIIPVGLQKGDVIGIASPSHIATKEVYAPFYEGIRNAGFIVKEAKNLYASTYGYSATEQERAEDINELAADESVKMVLFDGGEGAVELLPYLDYEVIGKNPKMYLSFSDGTTILNAIYRKTGIMTLYGQAPYLFANMTEYDKQQFVDFCMKRDVKEMKHNSSWRSLHRGYASGILIGGYLLNFLLLLGNPEYTLDLNQEYILFLEDHEMFFNIPCISGMLSSLEQHPFMSCVKGLLFGNYSDQANPDLYGKLARIGERWNIPVCYCDDFGHGKNHAILRIGAKAQLDADAKTLTYL